MTTVGSKKKTDTKTPLTRERVFEAAARIADEEGLNSLTMRRLAEELDVEAMSLYYHVPNKEGVLDGAVEHLMGELEDELGGFEIDTSAEWKSYLRQRILTARSVMLRHPWAPGVFETRTTISPTTARYFDAIIGIMKEGGFSYDLAHHAMHALGSRALGFTQEMFQPASPDDDADMDAMLEHGAEQFPYMIGMLSEVVHDDGPDQTLGWCDDQTEFEFGLDLLLDGLEQLVTKETE